MATVIPKKDKAGNVKSYKFMVCVGRDEHYKQIWRTTTLKADDSRITETTPKKKEKQIQNIADEWGRNQQADYDMTHSRANVEKITFAAFVNDVWIPQHVMDGSHKPTSIAFYNNIASNIVSYFGNKKLTQITAAEVKRYIVYLQTKATTKDGQPLSKTTVIRHYQTLRNVLNFAIRFGYLKDDPCKTLSVKDKPTKESKSIDFLEPKEAQRFMKALEEEPLFWRALETVLITCGLRRGEAIGLQWRDIDPDKLTLTISRNITIDANSPDKISVGTPKSGHGRTVPLSAHVYTLLVKLKHEQEERYQAKILPSAYIFCRAENPCKPIYPTEPTRWQSKFVKRHGLKNVSPHDLRHTAASLAIEAGASLKSVQMLLGHEDSATTMEFYAGITEQAQRKTVEGIESLLASNEK